MDPHAFKEDDEHKLEKLSNLLQIKYSTVIAAVNKKFYQPSVDKKDMTPGGG